MKVSLSGGINIKIVKKAKKQFRCGFCPEPIKIGDPCISAFGFDYDMERINERIHIKPECYQEWVSGIDMIDDGDIARMIRKAGLFDGVEG